MAVVRYAVLAGRGYDDGVGGPVWRVGERAFDCSERTLVMGILNVTPDSFSEDGRFFDPDEAVRHAGQMFAEGADVVDVGGESTRPGSDPVPVDEEIRRVLPVIERIVEQNHGIPVSIDTRKAEVADRALAAGATIVNDVSAGGDPEMFDVVRKHDAAVVLMHMRGEPKTMQEAPEYEDVLGEVHEFLRERIEAAEFAGIEAERIAIDPGIGFGKNLEHNLELMRRIDAFLDLGRPVLVGPSRKRFIGAVLDAPEDERVEGTIGAVAWMVSRGAHAVRVHDVREVVRAVRVIDAIVRAGR
jgi:dihydropteroate synthase